MRYVYLVNRFNLKEKTEQIINRLKTVSDEFMRDYEIVVTDKIEDIKDTIERYKDHSDILTAIGGDGSINLLLNSIINTNNVLSFIPSGTGNDFCRASMQNLENGIHEVDIVKINDRYFINVACFGIDADIANDERYIHNKLIPSSLQYHAGVVHHFLTYKPRKLKVECEKQIYENEYTTVVVANNRYYGGGYNVSPLSSISDGKMEVLIVDKLDKINMAKTILSMKDGKHLQNPALKSITTNKVSISADSGFYANIDGEALYSDRFDMQIIPKGFKVEFNKEFINKVIKN